MLLHSSNKIRFTLRKTPRSDPFIGPSDVHISDRITLVGMSASSIDYGSSADKEREGLYA